MNRRRHLASLAVGLCVVLGTVLSAIPANAGGTGGGPTSGGGGISGGGGGTAGGAIGAHGNCGPGMILAIYDNGYWNGNTTTPFPSASQVGKDGKSFMQHVWTGASGYDPSGAKLNGPDSPDVFLVDWANGGYVWGPPKLESYQKGGAPSGEGWPPNLVGPFNAGGSGPGFDSHFSWSWTDWSCYIGGPLVTYDTVPATFDFSGLKHGGGTPTTFPTTGPGALSNSGQALVLNTIRAIAGQPGCPAYTDANVLTGLPPANPGPKAPNTAYPSKYNAPPAGCPNFGLNNWTSFPQGTFSWYAYVYPVVGPDPAKCTSGSGPYIWDWQPSSYTGALEAHCTNTVDAGGIPYDDQTFYHVHQISSSQDQTACKGTLTEPPHSEPSGCGLNVTLTEHYIGYVCFGASAVVNDGAGKPNGDTWTWHLQSWDNGGNTAGETGAPNPDPSTGASSLKGHVFSATYKDGFYFQYDCNDGGNFDDVYGTSAPTHDVDQIEPVANG